MAGVRHRDIHDNRRFRSSCPAPLRLLSPFARMLGRELAVVEIEGRFFHALVPQGTKFERALDKIIAKYGGGVAKLKYDNMEGREIVAVMIGDRCMVKGEPDKIARADFSAFGEMASAVKGMAIEHARSSRGGIHFFAGLGGIPIAVGKDGEVVFLNASEVEIGKNSRFFSVRRVDYDKDPKKLSELGEGPIEMTDRAKSVAAAALSQEGMASSHGGVRSEKLMLPESRILVFDIGSQKVSTLAEFASPETGFKAPQFVPDRPAPARLSSFTSIGIVYPAPEGDIRLPMDGSPSRIPYLFVKVFDGKLEDALNYKKEDGRYIPGWSTVPFKTGGGRPEAETSGRFTFVSHDRLPEGSYEPAKASAKPVQPGEVAKLPLQKQAPAPQKKPDRKPRRRTSASRHINRLPEQSSLRTGPIKQGGLPPDVPKRIPASDPPGPPTTLRKSREVRQRKWANNNKPKKSRPKPAPAKDLGQVMKRAKKGAKKAEPLPKAKTRPNPKPRTKKAPMTSRKPAPEASWKPKRPKGKAKPPKTKARSTISAPHNARPKSRKAKAPAKQKPRKKRPASMIPKAVQDPANKKAKKKKDSFYLEELLAHWNRRGRKFRMKNARAV